MEEKMKSNTLRKLPLDVIQQIKDTKDYEDIEKFFINPEPGDESFNGDYVQDLVVQGLFLGTRKGGLLPPNHLLTRMIDQILWSLFSYRKKVHDLTVELHELKEKK
jgi:hypothetical protein